jgi:hypothetical protein
MFDPDVYPLNPVCWDGKVTEEWVEEEHPLELENHEQPRPADAEAPERKS